MPISVPPFNDLQGIVQVPEVTPVPRLSLVESTITAIRAMIEKHVWQVGECIPRESELAEQFAVGRNTIREAVRVLSHSGMLEVRQGDGTYVRRDLDPAETVNRLNRSSLRDQIEMQCVLDAEAARIAARRRVPADMARLRKFLAARGEYSPENDLKDFLDRDRSFHFAIAMASHNEAIQAMYSYFHSSIYTLTKTIFSDKELPEPSFKDHAAIVDAIAAGDEDLAADAARNMLKPLLEKLDELLGARDENAKWLSKIGATYWR